MGYLPLAPKDGNNNFDLTASAVALRAITPDDNNDLPAPGPCRGIYVGTAGDLVVIARDDSAAVTLTAVPAGSIVPVMAVRVKSTGTTAGAMVALY